MSKELLVAGAIVVVCLGVTAVALIKPGKPAPAASTDLAQVDPGSSGPDYGLTTPPSSLTPPDSFGNPHAPAGTSDLNPNYPFTQPGPTGSTPLYGSPGNAFPGASSQPLPPLQATQLPPETSTFDPAPPTASTGPDASVDQVHVVKRGDTLGEISKRYYGTTKHWKKIKAANNVDPDGLREGAQLTIPALTPSETATPVAAATPGDAGSGVYVVKKNDTYYQIAKRELGDPSRAKEIEKLNQVSAADLRPGMKLTLPARGAREAASAESPAPSAGGRTHTVGRDEYLTDIAKKYYGSTKHWREIVKANPGVDPERLKVGQKLTIPDIGGSGGATNSGGSTSAAVAGEGEYVVVAGDTFEVIAGKALGDKKQWKKIAEVNPGVDSARLRIGQKLKLPAGASGAATSESLPLPAPTPIMPLPAPTTPLSPAEPLPGMSPTPAFPSTSNPFPNASSTPAPTPGDVWGSMGTGTADPTLPAPTPAWPDMGTQPTR